MSGRVRVRRWAFWLSPAGQQAWDVEWREGLRVVDLVPEDLVERQGLDVRVNGSKVPHLDVRVSPTDQVDVAIRPAGAEFSLATALISSLIATGASLIIGLLTRGKGPKKRDDAESDNFAYSGYRNTRVEGQPRQIVYGQIRVAPQIIAEYSRCRNTPGQEDLYRILSFGEGPLTSILGVTADTDPETPLRTNDDTNPIPIGGMMGENRLETLKEVELHIRLGTDEQLPILGHEEIWNGYEVDQELTQQESSSSSNTALNPSVDPSLVAFDADNGQPNATESDNAQGVWDEFGVSFVMPYEADSYTIVIGFPEGLYRITNSSGVTDAGFQLAIRYREVDKSGNPITVGGNRGNGWIYERPDQIYLAAIQEGFAREYAGTFYNPQGYAIGAVGKSLDGSGTSQYASRANPTVPASWAAATDLDGFTVEGWFRLWQLPTSTSSTDTHRPLFEWSDGTSTNNRGIGLSIEGIDNTALGAMQWVPTGFAGTPNGLRRIEESPQLAFGQRAYTVTANPTGWTAWHHVAFTYEKDPGGSIRARFRLYLDGQFTIEKVYTSSGNDHVQGCSADPFEFLRSLRFVDPGTTVYGKGALDEFRVWDHAKTAAEIDEILQGGQGSFGTDTTGLVAGYHFDSNANDYGTNANNLTLNGGATAGSVNGWVWTNPTGTPKRARYEVEVLRLNVKSTSNRVADETRFQRLYGRVSATLAYPNQPLVGIRTRADDDGDLTFLVKGKPVPVWDGLSTASPAIYYLWESSTFGPPPGRNPAWVALDIVTSSRSSLSQAIGFANVDLASFLELAQYADELVYDGKGARQTLHESDTDEPIENLFYDADLFGAGEAGIEIHFRDSPAIHQPPGHWKVGGFVGFTGLPTTSGIAVDLNTSAIAGFQIGEIENVSGQWIVRIRYDAATYGAPWTSGTLATVAYTGGTLTGTVEGREPRFQYDWVHDTFEMGWDTLTEVLATARTVPIMEGSTLRLKIERPRSAVATVTHANTLVEGDDDEGGEAVSSFELEYVGSYDRPNKLVIDFRDEEQNYERKSARVPFPGDDPNALHSGDIVDDITVQGITRRSQIVRHGSFILLVNRHVTRQGRMLLGLDALAGQAGDVMALSSDLVAWGRGGRIVSAASVTQVVLDREVTIPVGVTCYLRLRPTGGGQTLVGTEVGEVSETLAITTAAGTHAAGATITVAGPGFSALPVKDDVYVFFEDGQEFEASVAEITLDSKARRKVEWTQYTDLVYDVDNLEADVPVS